MTATYTFDAFTRVDGNSFYTVTDALPETLVVRSRI